MPHMTNELEERREALNHKTFKMMLSIAIMFGVPAAIGFFIGKWIDTTYDMRPTGTLLTLGATFIFSWLLVIRVYRNLTHEYRMLREMEETNDIHEGDY